VDTHAHFDSTITAYHGTLNAPEYELKLWLAHGITTLRDVGPWMGLSWTLEHKRLSAAGRITAPRIVSYVLFPHLRSVDTPEKAPEWVRTIRRRGADGIKFVMSFREGQQTGLLNDCCAVILSPEVHKAVIEEAKKLGMGTAVHDDPSSPFTALDLARLGV